MVALRHLFRSRRQQLVQQLPPQDWVQPWWVECWREQKDEVPASNKVARSWTLLGNLESVHRVAVDRRGLIAVKPGYWSLDWWLRVDDNWIFPSQHAAVRQRLVDGAPVVETIIRAAGGDLVHRVYGARLNSEYLVVEVENHGSRPVALAWAIRPYDHLGGGKVGEITVDDRQLHVDGQVALTFSRAPGRLVGGTGGVDPTALLDAEEGVEVVTCERGMASAAIIMPLVHGGTVQGMIPLDISAQTQMVPSPPSGTQVASGWNNHAVNASRFVLPQSHLSELFHASRQSLLLASTGEDIVPSPGGPPHSASDEAEVLAALVEAGYGSAAREIFIARAKRQTPLGAVNHAGLDVTSATISALGRAFDLAPDEQLLTGLGEFVADGARWILANPDETAHAGLDAAHKLLKALKADRAARELADLMSPEIEAEIEMNEAEATTDVLAMTRSAFAQLAVDPQAALADIEKVAALASPTMNWPSFIDPRTKRGIAGAGHDLRVTACFVRSFLRLLVDDTTDELLVALAWPNEWLGQGVEVHGVPSRHGTVSWAVRWHGERPALLWEVDGGPGDLMVRVPGLDDSFVGEGCVGEALLRTGDIQPQFETSKDEDLGSPPSGSFS
ncbi:MAG: hypothetical protein MKZ75_01335 [Acidimicrobiales bacterium]|nr:hypothetical protein [Acidimicrobiales bacterium]MEC9113461.1 hypothetical protein [Actinomycetota bacterium]